MRSDEEQAIVLNELSFQTANRHKVTLALDVGDVPVVVPYHQPSLRRGDVEVAWAVGGFDIWRKGQLSETDVSAEVAAQALVDEYRRIKRLYISATYRKKLPPKVFEEFMAFYDKHENSKSST